MKPTELETAGELAVVLATDCYATVQPVVSCLRRQGDPARLELVLVTPVGGLGDLVAADVAGFAAVRQVEVSTVEDLAAARAAGVRAATAPWVFVGETHSYPRAGWAAALIAAQREPWAALVPAVGNADRRGWVSRAGYFLDYARWGPWRAAGELQDPLIYNTAYRRDILLSFGPRLEEALDPYSELLWPELRRQGRRAGFVPAARIDHLSVGKAGANVRERFLLGLVLGGQRRRQWPWIRCAVQFLGSPLVPVVLVAREWSAFRQAPANERFGLGLLPFMLVTCAAKAVGEMWGYLAGTPRWVPSGVAEIEIHRLRYCPRQSP